MTREVSIDLPAAWVDFTDPVESFDPFLLLNLLGTHDSKRMTLRARAVVNVGRPRSKGGPPRTKATLRDQSGLSVVMVAFGDAAEILAAMESSLAQLGLVDIEGVLKPMGSTFLLTNPMVVQTHHVGRIVPLYPPTGKARKPRPLVEELTPEQIATQADAIYAEAFAATPSVFSAITRLPVDRTHEFLTRALTAVHRPSSVDAACKAIAALDQVGAWITVSRMRRHASSSRGPSHVIRTNLTIDDLQQRAGYDLTHDQRQALADVLNDLSGSTPSHRLLSGDTGSGKTAVYGLAAIAAAHAGFTVAILAPSEYLARQIQRVIVGWAGQIEVQLLTAGAAASPSARIVIGTTALLHANTLSPHFVIVDEQQAFSVAQRQRLLTRRSGAIAHLLEVTATCIPRSQAIAQLGLISVSRLNTCHVERSIRTSHYGSRQGRELFTSVTDTVLNGGRVLVVYPAKSDEVQLDAAGRPLPLMSLGTERAVWEKHFPSMVCTVYAGQDDETPHANQTAIDEFSRGAKSIMLATVVMERGHDIQGLRHVVIVQPERMGLMQMHQIRGRVAREGGDGRCDLYSPLPVSTTAMERITALITLSSGWDIAATDLAERGCGDLAAGENQHGGCQSPFRGRPLRMDHLERAVQWLEMTQ